MPGVCGMADTTAAMWPHLPVHRACPAAGVCRKESHLCTVCSTMLPPHAFSLDDFPFTCCAAAH